MKMKSLVVVVWALAGCAAHGAEPTVAEIFSDGAVLQRDRPIPVWGTAADGTEVTVALGGASGKGVASGGKWKVELPARPASAEPAALVVKFGGGSAEKRIENVLVGEVWLCSGQSNMAQIIDKNPSRPIADMPAVRQYGRKRGPAAKDPPKWISAEGDKIGDFSRTAIYFGEALHKELNVPIGLVVGAVSGTPIEQWVPPAALAGDEEIKAAMIRAGERESRMKVAEYVKSQKSGAAAGPDHDEMMLLNSLTSPGKLYQNHIEPTVPYGIRGVIWYQGEANSKEAANAGRYGKYLSLLISGFRAAYGQPELPFYIVQLPSIGREGKDGGPILYEMVRQQQLETVRQTPKTGLAVTIDVNEGLHPRSKHIVGERLASLALREVYGKGEGAYAGPQLEKVEFRGSAAECTFRHAEGGLVLKGEDLFEIAGADGQWHPAKASVEGGTLNVVSQEVASPKAVRYAYRQQMDAVTLFGSGGLPASPFVWPNVSK